jgi:hypothetical protein
MSLEWYNSFGFKEFDKELLEKKLSEGFEEDRLASQFVKQIALVDYPNVGKFYIFLTFPCDQVIFC